MSRRVLRASPLPIALSAVIALAAVLGFAFTKHSADQQERTLLQSDASQAALYAGSVFQQVGGLLDSLATGVALSNADPAVFTQRAAPFAAGSASVVLARQREGRYVVDSAVGHVFAAGQPLGPRISATLARAGAQLTPTPVVFNGRTSTTGFAVGPPLVPAGYAVYMQFDLDPFLPSQATTAKSFSLLNAALYGAPTASRSSLLVATTHQLPSGPGVAVTHTSVGTATWTLEASARSPLAGGFAHLAPYIVLALGLLIALSVGVTVAVLDRRQRYAAAVVAERTADLKQSLADLQEAQAALLRGERLAALGEMASVVGHELRNPLAAVTNALYLVRHTVGEDTAPAVEKHLAMAERETAKAASLAEDLIAFVRPRTPQKETVLVPEVVGEVLEATPAPPNVELRVDVEDLRVHADRRQLAEVLTNLVTNAYQAVGEAGSVRVSCHPNGDGAQFAVEDSGPGIDDAVVERLFEPFFTTKHDGTGLGLAIVRRLVEAHDGEVMLENRADGHGTRVVVHLPTADPVGAP